MSSPGIDQSYLAWFALAPLLLAVSVSKTKGQAFVRATIFGLGYNLVYMHWVLFTQAQAFAWTGMASGLPAVMAVLSWLIFSGQQAFLIGVFGFVARAIPLSAGLLPARISGRLYWPTLITIPLLWVLVVNKIGNGSWLLGIPWPMLEYSQYKQLPLLALCPYIGGIGLEAILVFANVCVACAIATHCNFNALRSIAYKTRPGHIFYCAMIGLAIVAGISFTLQKQAATGSAALAKTVTVAVVQGNIGMQAPHPRVIVANQVKMACTAPSGLCVWTEWSVPCYLSSRPDVFQKLADIAKSKGQDWLVGTMDKNARGQVFNTVCALSTQGQVVRPAYYKRFLVPFGEYIPAVFKNSPLNAFLSGSDDENFCPGSDATIFHLRSGDIAPIVCFESISPELVNESVRAGGQIITDLSDLKWFGNCILSDQMLASCVLRAAECNRALVFATNTGPSALIKPSGEIKRLGPRDKSALLVEEMPLENRLTPFCRWYR